jgi:hypothetical protein
MRAASVVDGLEGISNLAISEPPGLPGATKYGWLGACPTRQRGLLKLSLSMNSGKSAQEPAS